MRSSLLNAKLSSWHCSNRLSLAFEPNSVWHERVIADQRAAETFCNGEVLRLSKAPSRENCRDGAFFNARAPGTQVAVRCRPKFAHARAYVRFSSQSGHKHDCAATCRRTNNPIGNAAAVRAIQRGAEQRAHNASYTFARLRASGIATVRGRAAELNRLGVPTARGRHGIRQACSECSRAAVDEQVNDGPPFPKPFAKKMNMAIQKSRENSRPFLFGHVVVCRRSELDPDASLRPPVAGI